MPDGFRTSLNRAIRPLVSIVSSVDVQEISQETFAFDLFDVQNVLKHCIYKSRDIRSCVRKVADGETCF